MRLRPRGGVAGCACAFSPLQVLRRAPTFSRSSRSQPRGCEAHGQFFNGLLEARAQGAEEGEVARPGRATLRADPVEVAEVAPRGRADHEVAALQAHAERVVADPVALVL